MDCLNRLLFGHTPIVDKDSMNSSKCIEIK